MPTLHIVRCILIVPTNRLIALNTWWQGRVAAGELSADNPLAWPEIERVSNGAVMGRWSNGAYSAAEGKVIAQRLCQLSNITPPANWDSLTRAEKRDWINDQRNAVFAAVGIWYRFVDNDAELWPRFDDYLEEKGLRRKTLEGV